MRRRRRAEYRVIEFNTSIITIIIIITISITINVILGYNYSDMQGTLFADSLLRKIKI